MAMRNLLLFALSCTLAGSAHAQFVQQGLKLVGTGSALGDSFQGSSVALSADGSTAIVGGPNDNNGAGAAWVYTRSGGVWTQQGSKLLGNDGAGGGPYQGVSVALSADGNTALVGGVFDYPNGAAWVYARSGGVWTQQGSKLVGTGVEGSYFAEQGRSVSLSADGNTAIVGGDADNNGAGAAWVFTRSGGVWTQQGGKLSGTGAVLPSGQGWAVALSGDGNTAMVGGPGDNGGYGAAWVYTRSGGVWTQQGSKLVGTGEVGFGAQGNAVALSADGNTALVGASGDNNVGAAWVYTRSGVVWTQQGGKLVGAGAVWDMDEPPGISVSLSGDGNTALVGGPSVNDGAGAAWMYTRSVGVWTQRGSNLVGAGAVGNAAQGTSVALSADGTTAIVGGPCDGALPCGPIHYPIGAAWVFVNAALTAGPQFTVGGIVNAASFLNGPNGSAIAPGEIVTLFGAGIGPSTLASGYDPVNNVFATSVAGTQVLFDNIAAPIIYAYTGQTTVVAPYSLAGKSSTQVSISYQGVQSAAVTVPVVNLVPGIFTANTSGSGQAAAENHDYSLNSPSNPEQHGDFVQVFMTVGGEHGVDGAMAAGAVFDSPLPTATVGGERAQVLYAGPSPGSVWGLTQVDVSIPADLPLSGVLPLTITYGGVTSQADVTIAVALPSTATGN